MKLSKKHIDKRGDEWRQAGYTHPRDGGRTMFRYVRMRDGARVRVPSTRWYECEISRADLAGLFDVPTGTNQQVEGSGAASLAEDWVRVGYVRQRVDAMKAALGAVEQGRAR